MTEKQLQEVVIALALLHGCLVYHPYDSRRSNPGWPDLVIVGRNGILFRELKSARGKLTREQVRWIYALRALGLNAGVWRPDDWEAGVIATVMEAIK